MEPFLIIDEIYKTIKLFSSFKYVKIYYKYTNKKQNLYKKYKKYT